MLYDDKIIDSIKQIANKKDILLAKKIITAKEEGIQAQIDYANKVILEFQQVLSK
ncbi:MAG: hypothetical protein ABIN97_17060 [Ginsengibacter sp.]